MAGPHASFGNPFSSRALLEEIFATIPVRSRGVVRVAVDGVSGSGKTTFADGLADSLRSRGSAVIRASADDFHRPKKQRYRLGPDSPDGHYLESYDYDAMTRELLDPLGANGSRRYRTAVFDCATDRPLVSPECRAPDDAILIVDGLFLNRDELHGYWDVSIYLDVPFEIATQRCARRDGSLADYRHPSNLRYVAGETRYLKECRPRDRASIVIDNSDFSRPVRLR
jgi:uridine kinase